MKNKKIVWSLAIAMMCLLAPALQAQNFTISGTITWKVAKISLKSKDANAMADKPVVGAKVRIGPGNLSATTDDAGHYTIANVRRGSYTMHVKAKEHSSLTKVIVVNADKTYDIKMPWKNYRIGKGNRNVQ